MPIDMPSFQTPGAGARRKKPKDFLYYIYEAPLSEKNPNVTYDYRAAKCGILNDEVLPPSDVYHVYGNDDEEVQLLCSCPSSTYGRHPGSKECKHVPLVREVIEAVQSNIDVEGAYYSTQDERIHFPSTEKQD